MSITAALTATLRRPTATVYLNGVRWTDWLSLSRSQSYGDGISGGEASGRSLPSGVAVGTPIRWAWGYAGYGEVAGFDGVVTEIADAAYPQRTVLRLADPLWKASVQRKDIATSPLNSIAASTAITQILSAAGVSRLSIPALAAAGSAWAGSEWTLGVLTPVSFGNTTALAAAQQIADTLGYWLYADASGVVRATLMERKPSDSPTRTLAWGQDFLWAGTPSRKRADTLKNRVVIRGANTGVQGAQIQDAWQTGAADRVLELTFSLIEYVNESQAGLASCTAVAKQKLTLWSREPNLIEIPRLKADPRLSVGQTLAVQCALLGYSSPKAFFLYALNTTLSRMSGEFTQSLTLDGGTGDTGYTTMPPPTASFAWRLVRETLNGVGVVEVFLDGSGSTSFGGEMVAWAWTTATTVASGYPSTASGVRAVLVFPAATTTAVITLTVTDTSSKTGAITQTITLAGDATHLVTKRVISVALGAAWAVTPDGGATWNVEASGDSTLVPEVGGAQLLSTRGTGSTGLRGTSDALATASTALAGLGAITALSVTEGYPLRVWAAVGATVHQSLDGGTTFTTWGTLPASVVGILEDPAALGSTFFLAGADFYHGASVYYAGPAGATARQMVRGRSGAMTWIAYTGSFIGSPLQRVEGPISVTFPAVTPAVTEIRAIALSPDELSLYAWDAQGRGWTLSAADGLSATAHASGLASGETAMHALHDPDDSIVYLATFGATAGTTYKYFPLADVLGAFYTPASGSQAHRVGIGADPVPIVVATLIRLPLGAAGAADQLWFYSGGVWAGKTPPEAGRSDWASVVANPFNASELLLWRWAGGTNRLWYSADLGDTWTSVFHDLPMRGDMDVPFVAWSPTISGNWITTQHLAWDGSTFPVAGHHQLIRGVRTAYSVVFDSRADAVDRFLAYYGGDEEMIVHGDPGTFPWLNGANVLQTAPGGTMYRAYVERLPMTRKVAAIPIDVGGGSVSISADYHSDAYAAVVGTSGRSVAVLADGTLIVGGRADGLHGIQGVQEVADAWGTATITTALAGEDTGHTRADRQTQTVAACVIPAMRTAVRSAAGTWSIVTAPPAATALADWVEVTG